VASQASAVKPKPASWLERLALGERRLFAMSFNEVRGRPLGDVQPLGDRVSIVTPAEQERASSGDDRLGGLGALFDLIDFEGSRLG